jgi:hypothetical protein
VANADWKTMNQAPKSIIEEIMGLKKYREFVRSKAATVDRELELQDIELEMLMLKVKLNALYSTRPIPIPEGMSINELIIDVKTQGMSMQDILLGPPHMQADTDIPNKPIRINMGDGPQTILEKLRSATMIFKVNQCPEIDDGPKVGAGPEQLPEPMVAKDEVEAPKQPQTVSTVCLKSNLQPPVAIPDIPPSSRLVR